MEYEKCRYTAWVISSWIVESHVEHSCKDDGCQKGLDSKSMVLVCRFGCLNWLRRLAYGLSNQNFGISGFYCIRVPMSGL